MTRLLLRAAVFLGSAAIGLVAAALLVHGVGVSVWGFVSAVTALVTVVLGKFVLPAKASA